MYMEGHASNDLLSRIPNLISEEENKMLMMKIGDQEDLATIMTMKPDKALGSYGFTIHFYIACWHTIKEDLWRMINHTKRKAKLRRDG